MKDYLKQTANQSASLALIYIIGGLIMCFFSASILRTLVRIIGGLVLAYGAYQLYLYFSKNSQRSMVSLTYGIPCLIAGAVLLFKPGFLISFFPIIVGIIMVINAVLQLQRSFLLKDAQFTGWGINAIGALILLAGGLFLIFNPMRTVSWLFKLGGIFLIAEGIFMLLQSSETRKYL